MMKRGFSAVLLMTLFAALFACTESTIAPVPISVEGVVLNKATTSILVGAKEPLSAVVTPTEAENKAVAWSSSDAAIATVSAAGEVTGVAEGTATITVTTIDGAKTATCAVTVSKTVVPVTGVTLDKTTETVGIGATFPLVATVAPAEATNKAVSWSSSDESIATVSADGVVTGVALGTAEITATTQDGNHKATCAVTAVTVGDNYVVIGGLKWATGNLVSTGNHTCKIGAPEDGGLYFQFGSLIGYKGGAAANNGTGVGMPAATTTAWGGAAAWSWGNDVMVYPATLVGTPSSWPIETAGTAHKWFFSGQGVTSGAINATDVPNGVGDPCAYYLGGSWRLPTNAEYGALAAAPANQGPWVTTPVPGRWLGVNPGNASSSMFFPASGYRYYSNGSFDYVTAYGYYWSSSVYNATSGLNLYFYSSWVYPQNSYSRSYGFPVRCVAPVS